MAVFFRVYCGLRCGVARIPEILKMFVKRMMNMISEITGWVLAILLCVGLPLLIQETGLALAGAACLLYLLWALKKGK